MSNRRLTSRDYKDAQHSPLEFRRWKQFVTGLAAGLLIAGIVYIADHRAEPVAVVDHPTPRAPAAREDAADTSAATSDASSPDGKFDFYQMLPKFEVVVPEKERGSRFAPTAQVDRPGIYFLQAGSYRNEAEAERIRAQLAKLGIDASVQRVAVDTDVWHRVRIGPIRDLDRLNRLRKQLAASELDSLVIRVDD